MFNKKLFSAGVIVLLLISVLASVNMTNVQAAPKPKVYVYSDANLCSASAARELLRFSERQ